MTPEVAREMIPILEAIARGAKVERRCEDEAWEPQVGAMILNDSWEFRIMPREFLLAKDGSKYCVTEGGRFPGSVIKVPGKPQDAEVIHVREIL